MAAAHSATITEEGDQTIVRIPGKVMLSEGPILVREDEKTGAIILCLVPKSQGPRSWADFLNVLISCHAMSIGMTSCRSWRNGQ